MIKNRPFIILILLLLSARLASAQISLKGTDIPLQKALESIHEQSGYDLIYEVSDLVNLKIANIDLQNVSVGKALQVCFTNQPLIFQIADKTVMIKKRLPAPAKRAGAVYPETDIRGKVIDESGQPVKGATVMLWGDVRGTTTDAEGYFNLHTEIGNLIVVTCVGYKRMQFHIGSKDFVIPLTPDNTGLNEVQVIGYGTAIKRLNTATVSSVTAVEIHKQPVTDVLNTLNGRMTGVQVVQASGSPGAAVSIKVRGDNTLGTNGSTSSDPLYIVDGIPQASGTRYDVQNFNSNVRGMNGYTNIFSILNKEDIERIDVLKDADATAIYGARGANGVVLITTKKGKEGKVKINVNLTAGSGRVGHFIPLLNTRQYLDLRKEAFANDKIVPTASNAPDLLVWDQNANTDFQRMLLGGAAKIRTADVSISGGNELIKYYVGVNYRKEGTVVANDQNITRGGGIMNLNIASPNKKFNAYFSANYAAEHSNLTGSDFLSLIYLPPNFPLRKSDGSLNWVNNFNNPLAALLPAYDAKRNYFAANTILSYRLVEGLTLKTTAGYNTNSLTNNFSQPAASFNPVSQQLGRATFGNSPTSNYIIEPQAEYIKKIGPGRLTALLGTTFSQALSETTTLYGSNYTYDNQINTITGAGLVEITYNYDMYRYASVYSRINYDFMDKYIVSGTFRRDASSRFGPQNRFANFGSVAAAWLFSEEKLIKHSLSFLSYGRLKFSYGTTGNDRIDNYMYLPIYAAGDTYQDVHVLSPADLAANPAIKWESTRKAEINLSLGFLKDRILLNTNLYRNRSSDLLNYTIIAGQSGVTSSIENLDALIQNKGLELELTTQNIISSGFNWKSSFNISFERNKLLSFGEISKASNSSVLYIGESVDAYINRRKYKYAGLDPATGAPKFTDLDGKPGLGALDRYIAPLGNPFYGGFANNFSYKGFSLEIFFKFQNSRGRVNQLSNSVVPGGLMNQPASVRNRWTPEHTTGTMWPLAVTGSGALSSAYTNLRNSDFTYGNTSYIKLKTANLTYQLPRAWANKMKMQQINVSLQGLNLLTWAKDKYRLDPEYDYGTYPGLRTLLLAINCSL